MYEDLNVEDVKDRILSKVTTNIDVREGSFTNDMISAIAYEIWKAYQSLDAIVPMIYVDETSGFYIDKRCAEFGIERKEGTKATTTLYFTGTDGTTIPAGKVFLTSEGLEFTTNKEVKIIDGKANITATATEVGEEYNVRADTILRQYVNLSGLNSVTNTAAIGGTNVESDEALVTRFYDYLQKPSTSGNIAHYRQWATEVSGVGDAKVFSLWNGPGTVKVVIVDSDKLPANNELITETIKHIEEVRPIGANVTVVSGAAKEISISAEVVLASGYRLQDVIDEFKEVVTEYFKSIAFSLSYVSYAKVGTMLLSVEGVLDYNSLKINNTVANISLKDEEIPTLGTVELVV